MLNARTVSDFKIKRSKSGKLSVFYKGKQLLVFSDKVLFQVILETAPKSFLKSLAEISGVISDPKPVNNAITKFALVYSYERLKYYKKDVKTVNDKSVKDMADKLVSDLKNVKYFTEAVNLMREADVKDVSVFIKAQINGLKFVNDGVGTFPKPNQLATDHALTRLLEFTSSTRKEEKTDKPDRYWFFDEKVDGEVSLKDNTKYNEAIDKIKNNTASLAAALYAKKCYSRRREGQTYSVIEDYIKKISN